MKKRLEGLDIARAFAIFGMMLVNYALVFQADITVGIGKFIYLLEGRAAAVFMILAGVGIGLMTRQGDLCEQRRRLAKRALFLWAVGMILYLGFDWVADILHYYGAFMLLILPLLRWSKRRLELAIAGCLAVQMLLLFNVDYTKGWDFAQLNYVDFNTVEGFIRNLAYNGFHPIFPWFAFMLYGLWLSRSELAETNVQFKMMSGGSVIAVTAELASMGLVTYHGGTESAAAFYGTKPMPPNVLYMLAASGWATAFIGAMNRLAGSSTVVFGLLDVAKKIGQLSLSHYVIHSAVILTLADFVGLLKPQSAVFVLSLSIVVFVGMGLFSKIWLRYQQRGPLERMMRQLSDGVR